MELIFQSTYTPDKGALVLGIYAGRELSPQAKELDKKCSGALSQAIEGSRFKGEKKDKLVLHAPQGTDHSRIILVGLGNKKDISQQDLIELGAHIYAGSWEWPDKKVTIHIPDILGSKCPDVATPASLAYGFQLRGWRFDKYVSEGKRKKISLEKLEVVAPKKKETQTIYASFSSVLKGVCLTREVVSEPPNTLHPVSMADRAKKLADLGLKVTVLDEAKMKSLGMNSLLAVGQGSDIESRLITLEWQGADKKAPTLAIVGKGVTFDTGGISLKPSKDMDEMKFDMGGSGVVLGLMAALARRKAKVNVVGVMGMAENMPSGRAQRPGDIVKSMAGKTIEVLNTDAEGRMVLADALWYAQETFKPKVVIDLATLTGAIIMALGHEYAGLFSDNQALADQLVEAGRQTGEPLWQMPLCKAFDKDIDSICADMKNTGSGRGAGSATAAHFLQRFIQKDVAWAHLDIAGVVWDKRPRSLSERGATGFGVRLLNRFIRENYEV